MGIDRSTASNALILGATIMLTSSLACAAQLAAQTVSTQGATIVTVASIADEAPECGGNLLGRTRAIACAHFFSSLRGFKDRSINLGANK